MEWKDTLLPGASRVPLPSDGSLLPGWVLDTYGVPTERNDWVMGPQGVPVISGSNEAQPGYTGPVPQGNQALYAQVAAPAGQQAMVSLFSRLGLSGLHDSILRSSGPSIGGFPVGSPGAAPYEREAEALRKALLALPRQQFSIPQ